MGAVRPRPQSAPPLTSLANSRRDSISSRLPLPAQMSSSILSICIVPNRHGVHLPHDSFVLKSRKNLATSTWQSPSSMTIMPPEPIMEPASRRESKSTGVSSRLSGRQPPEGPPIWTALNCLWLRMPPAMSKMISRKVVPMGTSVIPEWLSLPARVNSAVPLLPLVPIEANQSAPRSITNGTQDSVFTLFSSVGLLHSPASEG